MSGQPVKRSVGIAGHGLPAHSQWEGAPAQTITVMVTP
jgi:hypothetical protein